MKYRKEIDGLRALAVIPVVLFHAGIGAFSGGFIGVDVFFVISGYLITGIIISERSNDSFSIIRFYERRARRILPALSAVMLACIPFALLWLTPDKLEAFSGSMVSVVFFVSNIFFWSESGYFQARADEKPLLHTWSLAVEEQFYIVFPLLLLVLWKLDRKRISFYLGLILVASLVLAENLSKTAENAAFFLLPSRAWELMAGAIIAYQEFKSGPVKNSSKGSYLSLLGIILIALSVFLFTSGTRHPSVYTLIPVIGTVLIIRYGRAPSLANRLLTQRIVVGVGLISYSLYLWHQPLFAFAHIRTVLEPPHWLMLILSVASVALAYLSWRYIEQPFRTRKTPPFSRKYIFSYSTAAAIVLSSIGMSGVWANGFPDRFDPSLLKIVENSKPHRPTSSRCDTQPIEFYFSAEHLEHCTLGNKNKRNVLLWGDSHADAIAWEVGQALDSIDQGVIQATSTGCMPVPGLRGRKCSRFNQKMSDHLLIEDTDTDIVILHGRWTFLIEKFHYDNGEGGIEEGVINYDTEGRDLLKIPPEYEQLSFHERLGKHINSFLNKLLENGKTVILVYPVPEPGWDVPIYTLKSHLYGNTNSPSFTKLNDEYVVSTSFDRFKERNARTHAVLDEISHPNLYRIYPDKILCDSMVPDRCVNSIGNTIYYSDDDHISNAGARLIALEIQQVIEDIQGREKRADNLAQQ